MADEAIAVENLAAFRRGLKNIDAELPRMLRREMKAVGERIASDARNQVPVVTGKARKSVTAGTSGATAFLRAGGSRAPYYAWLDFGGGIPNKRNRRGKPPRVSRPFEREGRWLFPTVKRNRRRIIQESTDAFERVANKALPDH